MLVLITAASGRWGWFVSPKGDANQIKQSACQIRQIAKNPIFWGCFFRDIAGCGEVFAEYWVIIPPIGFWIMGPIRDLVPMMFVYTGVNSAMMMNIS